LPAVGAAFSKQLEPPMGLGGFVCRVEACGACGQADELDAAQVCSETGAGQ